MTTKNPSFGTSTQTNFRFRLAMKMVLLLVPVTVLLILLMGSLIFTRMNSVMRQQISDQMSQFVVQTENRLDDWLDSKHTRLESISTNQTITSDLAEIISGAAQDSGYAALQTQIADQLDSQTAEEQIAVFDDHVVVNPRGDILVSNNETWEGKTISDQEFFQEILNVNEASSFVEFSPSPFSLGATSQTHDVVLISSQPVYDNRGDVLGYILGLSSSPSIQIVLEPQTGYLPENNLFIVNENAEFAGITDINAKNSLAVHTPNNSQIDLVYAGLSEEPLATRYESTDGSSVLGLYTFYPSLNIGFVIEYPVQINPVYSSQYTSQTILIIGAFALVIGGFLFLIARRFTTPIKEVVQTVQKFTSGDWEARVEVKRDDEIGMLGDAFNTFADELNTLSHSMENQVSERTQQIISAAEVSNITTNSTSMDDLLNKTAELIQERFDLFHTAIYLIDTSKEVGKLRAATGSVGKNLIAQDYQVSINVGSPYYWVIQNNQTQVVEEKEGDFLDLDLMPGARAKAVMPISIGSDVFGMLDVQATNIEQLSHDSIEALKTLSNQIASAVQNFWLLEGTEVDLQQISELFSASQMISQASTEEDVFEAVISGVQQTSYYAAFYVAKPTGLELLQPTESKPYYTDQIPDEIPLSNRLTYMFFEENEPILIKDVNNLLVSIRPELIEPAKALNCVETALIPISVGNSLLGLLVLASREPGKITQSSIQPFLAFSSMAVTGIEKVLALKNTQQTLDNFQTINQLSNTIGYQTDPESLYPVIHEQIKRLLGDVDFYIALYDKKINHIEIPYLYEGDEALHIDPFPLGEGLTSIVIKTQKPLMLVDNTEERALALGAKIVGSPAKSWLGIPLIVAGDVIGVICVQDVENEKRFTNDDLVLLTTLSTTIAGSIHSANLLAESQRRAYQLQTAAEISRETSTTLDSDELLRQAIQLVLDRFNFYHASVFIMDPTGEYAVVQESTGEAGKQMKADKHRLKVGSQSIIGYVTQNLAPLVVNDVTQDPTHRFNPLLPETRAELGIPIMMGERLLGALDVQSTIPFAFSPDDIEVLQILADQMAVAITNADLFTETQEHLAQHRLIHHVTTVAASSTNIEDALSSAVQGLRVTLGDRVSILLKDAKINSLRVQAASGYDNDVLGMRIRIGQGITGWAAEHSEAIIVNDVLQDPRYIPGIESVRSELAVPLVYRGELLGVLNIESDVPNAYSDHDQDILGTLAGSLSAIIVNARLSERQRQLFDITSKIRQSVNMETILETTANELTKALQTRRTRIQVGGSLANIEESAPAAQSSGEPAPSPGNGQEGEV